jgi:hypothetical protein
LKLPPCFSRQCLHRRIASFAELEREVAAWVAARNARQVCVDWRFTRADSRIRLKRLYPIPVYDN